MKIEEKTTELTVNQTNGSKYLHITISRKDTILNDLKNGTVQGIVSVSLILVAILLFWIAILYSYNKKGEAGYLVGVVMVISLVLSLASIIFGLVGLKNRTKIRHYLERRGILFSLIHIGLLVAVYVRGLLIFLQ